MSQVVYSADERHEDSRLDKFLSDESCGLSRSYIQKLISGGKVIVNGITICKSGYRIKSEDCVILDIPEKVIPDIAPEDIPLEIIYEDSDVIIVNKPKGMVVHPAPGHYSGTLVNALLYHCSDLSGINGVMRPGIVHRIDKDTSGLLVCAKNDFAHSFLAAQFKEHTITRTYRAIVCGSFTAQTGCINRPIGRRANDRKLMGINEKNGRSAVTHYIVISQIGKYSYIECSLETGRTHQIRVHMAYINHPVLGDNTYGGKKSEFKLDGQPLQGQTLHAKTLGFIHPASKEYVEFDSQLPEYFEKLLEKLRLDAN